MQLLFVHQESWLKASVRASPRCTSFCSTRYLLKLQEALWGAWFLWVSQGGGVWAAPA